MKAFTILLLVASFVLAAESPSIEQQLADAEASYTNRSFQEAVEKFQPLLKHFEESGNDQKVADIAFKMGRSNRRLGNFKEAHALLARAMQLHTKTGDKQGLGFDLTEIGIAHQRQGNYDEALSWSTKALAIHQEMNSLLGTARTQDNFQNIYYRRGEYDKALTNGEAALVAARQSGDDEILNVVLSNLGQIHYAQGNHSQALQCFEQASKYAEKANDLNGIATNLANSALVHQDLGDIKQSLMDLEKAGTIFHQVGNLPLEATNFLNVGTMQHELGNYSKTIDALQKSLQMAEEIGDKGLAATALQNLGSVETEIGNYSSALSHVRKSLALAQEIGEKGGISAALVTLGRIASMQEDYRSALQYYEKALRIDKEAGFQKVIHHRLRELGTVYAKIGNFHRAQECYQEALSLEEASQQISEMGWTYSAIGAVYRKQGDLVAADSALTRAIDLLQESGVSIALWSALYNKGLVSRDMKRPDQSRQWMVKAVEVLEGIRAGVSLPEERASFLENQLDVYEDLIALLVQTGNLPEAYRYIQRSKSRSFLDLLSEARIDPQAGMDPVQYNEKRKLLAKLVRLNGQIKEERGNEKPNAAAIRRLEKTRNETEEAYERLVFEIRKQNSRFAEIEQPRIFSLTEAQAFLDDKTILLDYSVGKKKSFLFAISAKDFQLHELPGEQKLSQQIHELLETLQKPEPLYETTAGAHSQYIRLASVLYREILKPIEPFWKDKDQIIVAADGPLHYLPFEALLVTASKPASIDFSKLPYLALYREIRYVPSISAHAAILQNSQENRKPLQAAELIAFADPLEGKGIMKSAVGDETIREWSASLSELPYARSEVRAISALYPKGKASILIGKDATESNVKTMPLGRYRMVHFASHGLIDEEHPQLSSIVLNAGNPEEDGFLTMREVFDLRLNADLVVLSACKTGLGKQFRGEGVSGLSRAFFCAGASSVLVSLWNVNDRSTADFMKHFYSSCIQKGMSKTAALKAARFNMIQSKKYSHPYYWSPFVLIGAQ